MDLSFSASLFSENRVTFLFSSLPRAYLFCFLFARLSFGVLLATVNTSFIVKNTNSLSNLINFPFSLFLSFYLFEGHHCLIFPIFSFFYIYFVVFLFFNLYLETFWLPQSKTLPEGVKKIIYLFLIRFLWFFASFYYDIFYHMSLPCQPLAHLFCFL